MKLNDNASITLIAIFIIIFITVNRVIKYKERVEKYEIEYKYEMDLKYKLEQERINNMVDSLEVGYEQIMKM